MATKTDWAWAAGFMDGEGSFTFKLGPEQKVKKTGEIVRYGTFYIQVTNTDLSLLEKLQQIFGYGRIVTNNVDPVRYPGRKPRWHFSVAKASEIERIINNLWPYL